MMQGKRGVALAAGLSGMMILLASALAHPGEPRAGRDVSVTGVFEDVLFLAGGRVGVNARGEDDVVAAGGDLTVQGASADHMMLGAYKIVFVDSQAADLFAAGADLSFLSGRLADDMVAAAGQLVLRPAFAVDGTAVLSGADVVVEAPVGGELRVLGGVVRIDAAIGGDVDVTANRLVIGPGARIEGDLRHRAGTVEIAPAATVVGETIALEPPAGEVPKAAGRVFFAAAVLGLLFTLGMVVLVLVTITLLPGLMGDSAQMIRARPLATLGIGGLIVAAAPLVLGLLFASVIGIPLALLIAALYLAAAPLALAASTYTGGLWARRQLREQAAAPGTAARLGWTALSLLALFIVGLIPMVGSLGWWVAYVFGMGAVITQAGRALSRGADARAAGG